MLAPSSGNTLTPPAATAVTNSLRQPTSAIGTGTQMGSQVGITLNIYDYSTPADKQILVQAFEKGQNQGLVNAQQDESGGSHRGHGHSGVRLQLHPNDSNPDWTEDSLCHQPPPQIR